MVLEWSPVKERDTYTVTDTNYHGMLNFYSYNLKTGEWHEYDAKFTDGECVEILLKDFHVHSRE